MSGLRGYPEAVEETKTSPWTRGRLVRAAGVGVLAGALSGLFGVGGGIFIVPGLVFLLGMDQRMSHGTSLAAILPIAAAGVISYTLEDSVDWTAAAYLAPGTVIGAFLGTRALQRLALPTLRMAFAILILVASIRLFVYTPSPTGRGDLDILLGLGLVGIGMLAGILAGLFGVGGGIVMVPALVILFSVPDAVAKGTSLLVIIPAALAGTSGNLRNMNADLTAAAVVGAGGVLAAFGAAQLSVRLDPDLSGVLFGALGLVIGTRMLLRRGRAEGVQA